MRTLPRQHHKRVQLRAKACGTPVTLKWTEWPQGEPAIDPTTGAASGNGGVEKECTVKAMVHFVAPATTAYRAFAEVQAGDCIVDLVTPLVRVTDPGGSPLKAGEVVDQFTFSAVNRATSPPATGAEVSLDSLKGLFLEIDGQRWVQKEVGRELALAWDAVFAGTMFAQSLLLRRGT